MAPTSESGFSHTIADPARGTDRVGADGIGGDGVRPNPDGPVTRLRISETFTSRQGEGKLTGQNSFFIRTTGCNLRCWFCDTGYASWHPQGDWQSIDDLVAAAAESQVRHVVLTGGEPMLPAGIVDLCRRLRDADFHITIETAGTVDRDVACDLLSLSPKLDSSTPDAAAHPKWAKLHQERRMPIDTMRRLIDRAGDHQVKFVVCSERDFAECTEIAGSLGVRPADVWIMPEGVTTEAMDQAAEWLRPWCESAGYRFCDRMQIRWYGNRRGT